VCGFGG
jgi:hypothetical protein